MIRWWRKWWTTRRMRRVVVTAIVGLVLGLCWLGANWSDGRLYAIYAQTRGLDVVLGDSAALAWRLEQVTVCYRTDVPEIGTDVDTEEALCSPGLYDVERLEEGQEFQWPAGTHLQISRVGPHSPLEIDVLGIGSVPVQLGGRPLPVYSRLVIDNTVWMDNSTLTLVGAVTVGDAPGSGSQFNLIGGSYAISEKLLGYSVPVEIVSGTLRSGDIAQIMMSDNRAEISGFIEPAGPESAGFDVSLFTSRETDRLQISRGSAGKLHIDPTWMDRALRNPLLLAIAAIVALLGGIGSAVSLTRWLLLDEGGPGAERSIRPSPAVRRRVS